MKKFICFLFILSGIHLSAATARSENSGLTDDYKLYDRNQAGLDFNPYSFPGSNQSVPGDR